jgi:hypothetical protein
MLPCSLTRGHVPFPVTAIVNLAVRDLTQGVEKGLVCVFLRSLDSRWVCAILGEGGLWNHLCGITRRKTSVTL